MRVPLFDLTAQLESIGKDLERAVGEVIASGRYVGGPRVEAFESAMAATVGTRFAIGVSSGTDALLASLMALGIGPGQRVLTTGYSFFATAGTIARVGAEPVFLDIDPRSYNLSPDALACWLECNPDRRDEVAAILPVHLYGQCADMGPILDVAGQYGIPIVEDAAQAIGARAPSVEASPHAGAIGDLGCFSFFPTKNLGALGDGGMITTDDEALASRIRMIADHGAGPKHHHPAIGGNFRLDPIQAAALLVKLPHLDHWHACRRRNATRYDEAFAGTVIETPEPSWTREEHTYNQYVVFVPNRRDALCRHLERRGIGHEVYYPVPLHLQPSMRHLGYAKGDLPHAEHAAQHCLALPIYPELTAEMQQAVTAAILEFYDG